MERNCPRFLGCWSGGGNLELGILIVPDVDDFVRACDDERLPQANVHTIDLLAVIRAVHVLWM